MRIVVILGAAEIDPWLLPPSVMVERHRIAGGERTMYEVAAAAAALGHDVELRGDLSPHDHRELCRAAGVELRIEPEPRRPTADDLVLVPEGYEEPELYARVALSPARAVMAMLAAPGLFGPPIFPGFTPPPPLDVDPDAVGLPSQFATIRRAGFEMWTNMPTAREVAAEAGVECTFIGTGNPIPFPEPGERSHDVAIVTANRWTPLTRRVLERLDVPALEISEGDRDAVLAGLGRARVFVHPAVIEGQSRLQIEARAMGAVPIGLRSNRFVAGLAEGGGVEVDTLEDVAQEVRRLLASPEELAERSARGMRSAREQVDWDSFLGRLRPVLEAPAPADPAREARAGLGEAVERLLAGTADLRMHARRLEGAERWLRDVAAAAEGERDALRSEVEWMRQQVEVAAEERDAAATELDALRRRRSVRLALWASGLLRPGPRRGGR